MPANVGLSSVPSPSSGWMSAGSTLVRRTASIRSAECTVSRSASVACGAATRGIAPSPTTCSCSARRTVRSTRIGFIGWVGPKSYVVSVGSNTTHEEQAAM